MSPLTESPAEQVSPQEREKIPQELSIPRMFAAVADAFPENLAVSEGTRELTYRELNVRSSQLAQHLYALGVGTDALVGLCLPRSIGFVVGALAILKAGGAYVPIDPALPKDRLSFMLNDAGVSLLVTDSSQAVPSGKWKVLALDVIDKSISGTAVNLPQRHSEPGNLAYVIYTSGSTGRPKGVEITNGGLLNLIHWHQRAFAVTSRDRASMLANVGFDASVWELWPYLTAGASLHFPTEETIKVLESLRDWIVECRLTIGFAPTPTAEQLLRLEWPCSTVLRVLLTGGDVLHEFPAPNLPFQVVNNYGPTENTVVTTSGIVAAEDGTHTVPHIGRAISNSQVYILNEHLRAVPTGDPGELYIGGASLARGYRNHPELTAERFIPSPFSEKSGQRLYRTGDRGKYLPDGNIAFLGRIDEQIKIRGYRIEPDEIVAVLNGHPTVRESVVTAVQDPATDKRLVAYVVPANNARLDRNCLWEFLRRELPDYMIPAAFVQLESLPLTPHGKVDRAALPTPSSKNILQDESAAAAHSLIEEKVAKIVGTLLGITDVGLSDNFFLLGGHSLLGTQLIASLRNEFGIELSLRSLFEAPTVEQLSQKVEDQLMDKLESMSEDEAERLLRRTAA